MQTIFREIMSACRALEKRVTVAYLGPAGTFSEQAVYQHSAAPSKPCRASSIDEVFRATEAGTADFGVVPVENSTEGAVNRTLDLMLATTTLDLRRNPIPVHHSLMTQDRHAWTASRVVCAHSQSLAQCQGWLNQHYPDVERARRGVATPKRRVWPASDADDRGDRQRDGGRAVQAGRGQGATSRTTRTTARASPCIGRLQTSPSGRDQTSLVLAVPNKAGRGLRAARAAGEHGVSMTRFESRPARIGTWEYLLLRRPRRPSCTMPPSPRRSTS